MAPPTGEPPLRRLPESTSYTHVGPRFDLTYRPRGPLPDVDPVTVTLKVHVEFKDFDRSMMRRPELRRHRWTRAQLGQFAWPDEERRTWVQRFRDAVASGWKEKHTFVLDEPDHETYRATCSVRVVHVDRAEEANTAIVAQWVPPGAPRLRSSVSGRGATAELDARDVDEPETHTVPTATLARQAGPFDLDSATLNAAVVAGIETFERAFRRQREPGGALTGPIDDVTVHLVGRASSSGPILHNRRLAEERAFAVADRVMDDLGLGISTSEAAGETHASADPRFQRVDIVATRGASIAASQNTAAHEAGHMFGLGDEYVEESPPPGHLPRFQGDPAAHDADVRATMGEEMADELRVGPSASIMASGGEVRPGHYVYFLRALNSVTSRTWRIE